MEAEPSISNAFPTPPALHFNFMNFRLTPQLTTLLYQLHFSSTLFYVILTSCFRINFKFLFRLFLHHLHSLQLCSITMRDCQKCEMPFLPPTSLHLWCQEQVRHLSIWWKIPTSIWHCSFIVFPESIFYLWSLNKKA